ncbi:TPA: hypothetical protein LWO14_002539, partial [Listeria innocua]|nr:hypothetical protein [Listeria innocua]HBM4633920.1 hypothetical protein [Listeria innocua]
LGLEWSIKSKEDYEEILKIIEKSIIDSGIKDVRSYFNGFCVPSGIEKWPDLMDFNIYHTNEETYIYCLLNSSLAEAELTMKKIKWELDALNYQCEIDEL